MGRGGQFPLLPPPQLRSHSSTQEWQKQPRYQGAPFNESHSNIDRAALIYADALVTSAPAYTRRLAIAAQAVRETFPTRGPILWRLPHDYGGRELPLGQFGHLVDQITRDVLGKEPGFELDETGPMLRGAFATNWMRDFTHPAKVSERVRRSERASEELMGFLASRFRMGSFGAITFCSS